MANADTPTKITEDTMPAKTEQSVPHLQLELTCSLPVETSLQNPTTTTAGERMARWCTSTPSNLCYWYWSLILVVFALPPISTDSLLRAFTVVWPVPFDPDWPAAEKCPDVQYWQQKIEVKCKKLHFKKKQLDVELWEKLETSSFSSRLDPNLPSLTWKVVCGFCCAKIGCGWATDGPGQWACDGDGACLRAQQGGLQRTDGVKEDRRQATSEAHRTELTQFWVQLRAWKETGSSREHQNVWFPGPEIWRISLIAY